MKIVPALPHTVDFNDTVVLGILLYEIPLLDEEKWKFPQRLNDHEESLSGGKTDWFQFGNSILPTGSFRMKTN